MLYCLCCFENNVSYLVNYVLLYPLIVIFRADIALIGLAVMGQNLILNMNDHGFIVCAYNRTTSKVDEFLKNEAKGTNVIGAKSLNEMVKTLKKPRRVMMLVKGIVNSLLCILQFGCLLIILVV